MTMNRNLIATLEDLVHEKLHPFMTVLAPRYTEEGIVFCEITLKFKTDEQLLAAIEKLKQID